MAAHATFTGMTTLCETVLCPKDEAEEYHNLDCIQGSCELCGVSTLRICPQELSMSSDALVEDLRRCLWEGETTVVTDMLYVLSTK